jgi:hypothetical protein
LLVFLVWQAQKVVSEDSSRYPIYNAGGKPVSLGELAEMVQEFLFDAKSMATMKVVWTIWQLPG